MNIDVEWRSRRATVTDIDPVDRTHLGMSARCSLDGPDKPSFRRAPIPVPPPTGSASPRPQARLIPKRPAAICAGSSAQPDLGAFASPPAPIRAQHRDRRRIAILLPAKSTGRTPATAGVHQRGRTPRILHPHDSSSSAGGSPAVGATHPDTRRNAAQAAGHASLARKHASKHALVVPSHSQPLAQYFGIYLLTWWAQLGSNQ